MAFLNLSLLVGGLFVAIPIVLHLAMRQQPKVLVFPALRFLKERRESNTRKLRLRHWLLLALRCGAIAIAAGALARPSVASAAMTQWLLTGLSGCLLFVATLFAAMAVIQKRGKLVVGILLAIGLVLLSFTGYSALAALGRGSNVLIGNQEAPVAAVMVIDSSPRMQYRHENQTRLEAARGTAEWLLRQLPPDSEVAVLDSQPGPAVFAVDLATAQKQLERLQTTGAPSPLPEVLERATTLAKQAKKSRKEIYIFTDLARGAWDGHELAALQRQLSEASDVLLYVIDMGIQQPQNFLLDDVQLSGQILPKSGELSVTTTLSNVGPGGTRAVELWLEEFDITRPIIQDGKPLLPNSKPRAKEIFTVEANGSQRVQFSVRGLELGVHHGQVRVLGEDGLTFDNVRHFTVDVQEAWPVLVVQPAGVSNYLAEALAPPSFEETGQARFRCDVIAPPALANQDLSSYSAVCLLDPPPLTPPDWAKLADYAMGGGGVAIFLGHNAQATASFNVEEAQRLIAGPLARQWRSSANDVFLSPKNFEHPVTLAFRDKATTTPWNAFPVHRHWGLEPLVSEARVIVSFSNSKPALIERLVGRGRALTLTTPVSEPAQLSGRQPWNELTTADDAWPCFVLVNEMLRYLVNSGESKLNYVAGQTAVLRSDVDRDPERYQLFLPSDEVQDATARDGKVTVKFTDAPGAYRLKGFRGVPIVRGFSVNVPAAASDLTRITRERLDQILGRERYQFASTRAEINRGIGEARVGREFFPYLIVALVLILAFEQILSNRFYEAAPTSSRKITIAPLPNPKS